MFNRSLVNKYLDHKDNPRPVIEVTEDEFIRLWVENGGTKKDAKFHLKMSMALGSSVEIGDKMYQVK